MKKCMLILLFLLVQNLAVSLQNLVAQGKRWTLPPDVVLTCAGGEGIECSQLMEGTKILVRVCCSDSSCQTLRPAFIAPIFPIGTGSNSSGQRDLYFGDDQGVVHLCVDGFWLSGYMGGTEAGEQLSEEELAFMYSNEIARNSLSAAEYKEWALFPYSNLVSLKGMIKASEIFQKEASSLLVRVGCSDSNCKALKTCFVRPSGCTACPSTDTFQINFNSDTRVENLYIDGFWWQMSAADSPAMALSNAEINFVDSAIRSAPPMNSVEQGQLSITGESGGVLDNCEGMLDLNLGEEETSCVSQHRFLPSISDVQL